MTHCASTVPASQGDTPNIASGWCGLRKRLVRQPLYFQDENPRGPRGNSSAKKDQFSFLFASAGSPPQPGKTSSFVRFLSRMTTVNAAFCVKCCSYYRQRKMSRSPGWSASFCAPESKKLFPAEGVSGSDLPNRSLEFRACTCFFCCSRFEGSVAEFRSVPPTDSPNPTTFS